MITRLACLAALWLLTLLPEANAQTPFEWSTSVIYDLRGAPDPVKAVTDAFDRGLLLDGMAVLLPNSPGPEKLDLLVSETGETQIHVFVSQPDSSSTSLLHAGSLMEAADVAGIARSIDNGEVGPLDSMPELLKAEVDWEAAFVDLVSTQPPRVLAVPPTVSPSRLARLLFIPAGVILTEMPDDEVVRTAMAFRLRHPAVGAGRHERLVNNNYTFYRSLEREGVRDDVVIVFGAAGPTTVNVSRAFADDTLVQDALTGRTAFVSFGMARFEAHESGLLLIEVLP